MNRQAAEAVYFFFTRMKYEKIKSMNNRLHVWRHMIRCYKIDIFANIKIDIFIMIQTCFNILFQNNDLGFYTVLE